MVTFHSQLHWAQGISILYQFVTHHIFKELMKQAYPVVEISEHDCESPGHPLTYEEQNALHYVAGYIIRKVQQKLETCKYSV